MYCVHSAKRIKFGHGNGVVPEERSVIEYKTRADLVMPSLVMPPRYQ